MFQSRFQQLAKLCPLVDCRITYHVWSFSKGSNLKNKLSKYLTSIGFNKCISDFLIDFLKSLFIIH